MKSAAPAIEWLRGLHRGYKFAILLIAAWAPFLFPENPLLTWALMTAMTALFFMATGRRAASARNEPPLAHEKAHDDS